ncbi:WD40 repeat-containing protein [Cavenderia fasciculata]|uniref:WD40 repeat-containing protein n=1 Tax=Cavenderia fasciculata TaxID=261658 RepID=F4Q1V4_CACFS|nr:WD40 repeat-containing protein [Cavenderia fasciculata]EGG17974.1 WD40 repeat-containing protein [Cavenderia fasciculata]|eukprot:XP_004356866.1 WD40 repeat-containing protein [Cavenderia fasciculata]
MFGAPKDIELPQPPTDGVSCLKFAPKGSFIAAGSWDKNVRCWEVLPKQSSAVGKAMINNEAHVLCTDWSSDCTKIYVGGTDSKVKCWNLATNQLTQVAQHGAPVKEVFWIEESQVMVTGSWDKTLKYWDMRMQTPILTVDLPERVYALDVLHPLLVVATADRKVIIYDLNKPGTEFKRMESPLKHQTRSIACFSDRNGFALGSIEGRVAIQSFSEKTEETFTFKCHRENDILAYPVNSISFAHPFGTFATAGSDGTFNFWDKETKNRLKQFPKCPTSISCATFSPDATMYAYAVSYDWCKGADHVPNLPNNIHCHVVPESEIKGKGKRR